MKKLNELTTDEKVGIGKNVAAFAIGYGGAEIGWSVVNQHVAVTNNPKRFVAVVTGLALATVISNVLVKQSNESIDNCVNWLREAKADYEAAKK